MYLYAATTANVARSHFVRNRVTGLGSAVLETFAGAVAVRANCKFKMTDGSFVENSVEGGKRASGGAMAVFDSAEAVLQSVAFVRNSVSAAEEVCQGGAVSVRQARLELTNSTCNENKVNASNDESIGGASLGVAFGGAFFLSPGTTALISETKARRNIAVMGGVGALESTAGFAYLDKGASCLIRYCSLEQNQAGGKGCYEIAQDGQLQNGSFAAMNAAASKRAVAAAHIFSLGELRVEQCVMNDGNSGPLPIKYGAPQWIVCRAGSAVLHDSTFTSSVAGRLLLQPPDATAEVVMRGCYVNNLQVEFSTDAGRLGILNSSFRPPLESSVRNVRPPECGVSIAGLPMCDPRASCALAPSGVSCACEKAAGLQIKPGARSDGSECYQTTALDGALVSRVVRLQVQKPGVADESLSFSIRADAEKSFNGTYSTTARLLPGFARSGSTEPIQLDRNADVQFGQRLDWAKGSEDWDQAASGYSWDESDRHHTVQLDANTRKFSSRFERQLKISLNCIGHDGECAADGDVIETTLEFAHTTTASVNTSVMVKVEVKAVPSCQRTTAILGPDTVCA